MMTRTCLCLIRRTTAGGPEVLLGLKKTGFGQGRWVGLGGHIEDGEKPAEAAAREVAEESVAGRARRTRSSTWRTSSSASPAGRPGTRPPTCS